MRITENRVLALVVCVVCAVVSVLGIGGLKLKGQYNDAIDVFINGSDATHNMEYYLDRCAVYAADLAYESMQYLEDDTIAYEVLALSEELMADKGPGGNRYETYSALSRGVDMLYSELQTAGHGEEVEIELAYYDYQSVRDLIKRDDYYSAAAEYNKTASGFPAGIIASIWGVGWADTFGQ